MSDPRLANIEDLRRLAERRVPRPFFGYVDSGSYEELTLRANRRDLDALCLRQRVLAGVGQRDLSTTLLGRRQASPLILAPTGLAGVVHGRGEVLAARAAERAGVPFTLSTVSVCSMEEVRRAVREPFWFQLYVMRDRGVVADLMARAQAVQCPVLVVTVDLSVQGQRHRDVRNGMLLRSRLATPRNIVDMLGKPRWLRSMIRGGRPRFGNLARYIPASTSLREDGPWVHQQLEPNMNWDDLAWIRSQWPGRLVVKGLLDTADARRAVEHGADAIVVSNHGGRQLDGAPSSIAVLPAIADAVGSRCELLFDGGVRSGADVLKALASGARGVMVARAWLYGLGALGEAGVDLALEMLHREFDAALALSGTRSIGEIGPDLLWRPPVHGQGAGG